MVRLIGSIVGIMLLATATVVTSLGSAEWMPSPVRSLFNPELVVGPAGDSGPEGPTGPQGEPDVGKTGATGAQGESGAVGATGPPGPPGSQGPFGDVGPAGSQGAAGPSGAIGATGPVGPTGPLGATGPRGATGPQGLAGDTGPVGAKGATGPQGPAGEDAELGPYGSFFDVEVQRNTAPSEPLPVFIRQTDTAATSEVTVDNDSQMVVASDGVYDIQFSFQITKTSNGDTTAYVWLRKNGADVPDTNTGLNLSGKTDTAIFSLNYFVQLNAGENAQLMWLSDDSTISLVYVPASTTPPMPAISSAIVTINKVGG